MRMKSRFGALALFAVLSPAAFAQSVNFPSAGGSGTFPPTAWTPAPLVQGTKLFTAANQATFGDSISIGTVLTPSVSAWPYLIAEDTGANFATLPAGNFAVSGSMACDNLSQVFTSGAPSVTGSFLYTSMFGTNEAQTKTAGVYEVNFHLCNQADIAWLTVPATSKANGQTAAQTGSWVNDTSPISSIGMHSTTNGSTLTFSTFTTSGGPILLWYVVKDGNGGVFTYNVDGAGAVTVNATTVTAISTLNGATSAMGVVAIPVSAGSHSIVITVTSSTNAGNIVDIWGIGTPAQNYYAAQYDLLVGGVIRQQTDTHAADTLAYNNDALADVNTMQSYGLPVFFVPVRNYVNSGSDMLNSLHPNATGNLHLQQAFEQTGQMVRSTLRVAYPASASGNLAPYTQLGTNTTSTTALMGGQLDYYAGGNWIGHDAGYDSTLSRYVERIFSIQNCVELGGMANTPTDQSGFTPNLIGCPEGIFTNGTAPTVTGTGSPTIASWSTDTAGEITSGASATSLVLHSANASATQYPACTFVAEQSESSAIIVVPSISSSHWLMSLTLPSGSSQKFLYTCIHGHTN